MHYQEQMLPVILIHSCTATYCSMSLRILRVHYISHANCLVLHAACNIFLVFCNRDKPKHTHKFKHCQTRTQVYMRLPTCNISSVKRAHAYLIAFLHPAQLRQHHNHNPTARIKCFASLCYAQHSRLACAWVPMIYLHLCCVSSFFTQNFRNNKKI